MKPEDLQFGETTDHPAWDTGVELSPQGTIFSKSAFLRSLNAPFKLFTVTSAGEAVALVSVIEDSAGNAVRYSYTPYQGILLLKQRHAQPRQRILDEFRITRFVVGRLAERYRRIDMAMCWTFEDLRPFLWFNHHEPAAGQFVSTPRYTGLLDLATLDADGYQATIRSSRRQELKKAAAYAVEEHSDIGEFMRLYESTFARQGIALDGATRSLVESIATRSLTEGYGRLSSCSTPDGIAAMSLFLYDSKRAYYMFAANEPALRNTGAATRLMVENIMEAKRRGMMELDFVGVNSPDRGDYKLSFNPELKLYFTLSYARGAVQ
jgi:hypothetical protein